jgi:cephalosporin hydroxylase
MIPSNTNHNLVLTLPILRSMRSIQGWLEEDEADLLIATAREALTELPSLHTVVEIGSYCGRSTVVLASVVKAMCAEAKVYAIDPHTGEVGAQDQGLYSTIPTRERFRQNIADAGLTEVVELIPQYSFEVPWELPICLILIDGLHDYTNVSRDFFHFEPWIVPGAYIAFHDYADYYPGVQLFVDELVNSGHYQKTHRSMSMIVVKRAVGKAQP